MQNWSPSTSNAHVLAVGTEVIAAPGHPLELFAERLHQHFRSPRLVDAEKRVKLGSTMSQNFSRYSLCPVSSTFRTSSPGSRFEQLGIRLGQQLAYFANQLGQKTAGNAHAGHVAEKLPDRGKRGVADTFMKATRAVSRERRQPP